LRRVYGARLEPNPRMTHGSDVSGWTVGKHLVFTMGPAPGGTTVEAVAIFSNDLASAGFIASNEGLCSAAADSSPVHRPAATAPAPVATATLGSHVFRPRVGVRAPSGWRTTEDSSGSFRLA